MITVKTPFSVAGVPIEPMELHKEGPDPLWATCGSYRKYDEKTTQLDCRSDAIKTRYQVGANSHKALYISVALQFLL